MQKRMTLRSIVTSIWLLLSLTYVSQLSAEIFSVDSKSSFDSALRSAMAGDSIVWEDGVYEDIVMDVDKDGLFIVARTLGGTVFTGRSYAELNGDDMTFEGFQYVDGNIGTRDIVQIRGSRIHFTQINMRSYTCFKYLRIREESQFVNVTYCNFENRLNLDDQNIVSVLVSEDHPGFHRIQFCSFKNFDGEGNDFGIEPLRIGLSTQAERPSRTLVEYCYFTQCDGDGEIISSKASENVYRFNTFEGNPKAELVLRHGSGMIVYGNFFLDGKGGVRVREGQDHYIYNNYFFDLDDRAIILQNDDSDPLDNINVAFNLIHDCSEIILGGSGGDQPTDVTFVNNIFSDPDDELFDDPTGTETWINNIAIGDLGMALPDGIQQVDPRLEENNGGFFSIGADSPAINGSSGRFKPFPQYEGMDPVDTNVDLDIMKEARPTDNTIKDLGCSEYPHDMPIQPFATEENTGPDYNTSVTTSTNEEELTGPLLVNVYPNPAREIVDVTIVADVSLDLRVDLLHIDGRLIRSIYQENSFSGEIKVSENIDTLSQGTYLVKILGSQGAHVQLERTIQLIKL